MDAAAKAQSAKTGSAKTGSAKARPAKDVPGKKAVAVAGVTAPNADAAFRPLVGELLNFFYPMHYRIGMDLETVMCQGRISRKHAAILWLIHSRAPDNGWVRRKDIENRLAAWFEMSNSNISKLLRELYKPPLSLVTLIENPESGREKVVRLTKAGEKFVDGMVEASVDYLSSQLSHLRADELRWGVDFFALSFRASEREARLGEASRLSPPPGGIEGTNDRSRPKR